MKMKKLLTIIILLFISGNMFAQTNAGINYKNINYGVYIYPEPDAVVRLVENIQKGLIFSNLNKKLTQRRIGLGILND